MVKILQRLKKYYRPSLKIVTECLYHKQYAMKQSVFIFAIIFFANKISAQENNIQKNELIGYIVNEQKHPVQDVIIQLLKTSDSSLVKTEFSDEKGEFKFSDINTGSYFIQTNSIGYVKYNSELILLDQSKTLEPVILQKTTVALSEVTVSVRKPYIEREHGKMILNVENSIASTGSSAFEVIEKAPGVRVDNNDNISFKGRSGVSIWIDGKPTPMTGSDLANYLRGISSSAIDKIEFIANPSSKYDAAGSSIINIKLKKDKRIGTNGSISLAYGQGIYPKSNNGVSINHRNKKINLFGSYNYAYREAFTSLKLNRNFYQNDTFIGAYDQDNYLTFDFKNHIARAGIDYYANDKNVIGFVVSGVNNRFNPKGNNVSQVYDQTHTNTSRFETQNRSINNLQNYAANFNLKHTFDSTGTEITTDIDYAHYGNNTEQNFTTKYYDLNNNEFLNPYLLHGDLKGGLDIYSIKSDFVKPLKKNSKIETGFKSSYVIADNDLSFYNRSNGTDVYDSTKSNHFIYQENINAIYINAFKDWKKWSFQIGLRGEHTHVIGKQLVYNSSSDTSYIQLFPSAFAGYKINDKHGLELNYSRRINRPSYDQLNPFKFYLDPTTFKEGNPYLKPQTTESIELTHVFNQKIYTTLGFGRTHNNITEVIAPADNQPKLTIQTNKNLTNVDVYALNISMPIEVTKWWFTSNDINAYYASYTGNIARTSIDRIGNITFNFNSVNTFNINSTLSAELSGNYRARELYAFENVSPIWSINAGVQKKFFNNKAIVKLNVNDIFYTNKVTASTQFTGYKETFHVTRDTRVATISFTYKFGKNSVSPSRRRQGGADDIKQRAGGNGVG